MKLEIEGKLEIKKDRLGILPKCLPVPNTRNARSQKIRQWAAIGPWPVNAVQSMVPKKMRGNPPASSHHRVSRVVGVPPNGLFRNGKYHLEMDDLGATLYFRKPLY